MSEGEDKSEKTEEPTERKLQKAREEGDVAKSQEISGWFTLAAGLAVVAFMAPGFTRALTKAMTVFLEQPHLLSLDSGAAMGMLGRSLIELALILGLVYALLMVAAASGNLVQHGLLWTPKKIAPKLNKLNPVEGLKRMFGPQGWVNFLKGVGKIILVGVAIALVLWPRRHDLASFPMVSPARMLSEVHGAAVMLLIAALIAYAVIAALDFMFQRREFIQRNKMSRKELRDEYKETEGDPMVRAKLRQIRQERAQKRMMSKVPDAAVVITNPTHYAIALEYEQGRTLAPICIAKGVDAVALRIRERAEELDIPIVEDPPLARALFATSDLDEPIDPEHYAAVAKVIGYVMSLSDKRRR